MPAIVECIYPPHFLSSFFSPIGSLYITDIYWGAVESAFVLGDNAGLYPSHPSSCVILISFHYFLFSLIILSLFFF